MEPSMLRMRGPVPAQAISLIATERVGKNGVGVIVAVLVAVAVTVAVAVAVAVSVGVPVSVAVAVAVAVSVGEEVGVAVPHVTIGLPVLWGLEIVLVKKSVKLLLLSSQFPALPP